MEQKIVDVAGALFWRKGEFLICRRPKAKARGGLWEFAGGKVEAGETFEQALVRECQEELGVEVEVGKKFGETVFSYPDLTVRLAVFFAKIKRGEISLLEHEDARWIKPCEISKYDFCPADEPFLEKIMGTERPYEF